MTTQVILAGVLALVLAAAGFVTLRRARNVEPGERRAGRASRATISALGFGLLLLSYHAFAWLTPDEWVVLKVPRERWWMLVAGVALAVAVSVLTDRAEANDGGARGAD